MNKSEASENLMVACRNPDTTPAQIEELIRLGADVRTGHDSGWTPLTNAARDNTNPEVITALVKAGADLDVRTAEAKRTPLMHASAMNSNPDVITALLKAGADVNAKVPNSDSLQSSDGETALHCACTNLNYGAAREIMKVLIDAGADMEAYSEGETALQCLMGTSYAASLMEADQLADHITVLLGGSADINSTSAFANRTPLMLLCHLESSHSSPTYPSVVSLLLKAGAELEARDDHGWTPLMFAAEKNTKEIVSVLIDARAELEVELANGATALILAAAFNADPEVVSVLIQAGAAIEAKDSDGDSVLMNAANSSSNPAVITALLKAGADPSVINNMGKSALDHVKENENIYETEAHRELEDAFSPMNQSEATAALLKACQRPDTTPFQIEGLIKAGANLEIKTDDGFTPLMMVSEYNTDPEVLSVLIKAGADLEGKTNQAGTALMSAATHNTNPEFVSLIINAGAKVDARDDYKWTALTRAARYNANPEVLSALIKAGAEVDAKTKDGWTPLMNAASYNPNPEVVSVLIKAGAELEARDENGWTPLMHASESTTHPKIVLVLIEAGAELEARSTKYGLTPLMYAAAAQSTNPQFVSVLIEAGAELEARCEDGWTPLIYAAKYNANPAAISALIKAGASTEAVNSQGETASDCAKENGNETAYNEALRDSAIESRNYEFSVPKAFFVLGFSTGLLAEMEDERFTEEKLGSLKNLLDCFYKNQEEKNADVDDWLAEWKDMNNLNEELGAEAAGEWLEGASKFLRYVALEDKVRVMLLLVRFMKVDGAKDIESKALIAISQKLGITVGQYSVIYSHVMNEEKMAELTKIHDLDTQSDEDFIHSIVHGGVGGAVDGGIVIG